MRLLVVASMYPHPGLPYSGIFNRNCVEAMVGNGHEVVVLVPRPYLPAALSVHPRWAAYAKIPSYSADHGIEVHRPKLIQVPRFATTFQRNVGAYWQTRRFAKTLHARHQFEAVFSFDLSGAGGLAWRLGDDLGIPATGWAFGLDVRVPEESRDARELRLMLQRLDVTYYQSQELRDCAQAFLPETRLDPNKHVVLPHGIPLMQQASPETRAKQRAALGVDESAFVVLFLSRLVEGKGIHELLESFPIASAGHPELEFLIVGETPGFDDSQPLRARIDELGLANRIRLLPACKPEEVPDYHAAADLFAFPSKSEGMPNALLEAMALGTPSVSFDIPPIQDIVAHGECLSVVESFQAEAFGREIGALIESKARRDQLVATARRVVTEHYDIRKNLGRAVEHLQQRINRHG